MAHQLIEQKGAEEMIRDMITSMPVMLALTIGTYLLGVWIRTKSKLTLLNPMLISIPIIIVLLTTLHIPAQHYLECNRIISFMLGPCVVSLGLSLYEHRTTIHTYMIPILSAVIVGSIVGVVSVYALCRWWNLNQIFTLSLESKSVTVPIAMEITRTLGGNVSITAVSVAICGLFGGIIGPLFLNLIGIKHPIAFGVAMGSASHGLGTARAIEIGALQGAVSGLCIALVGIATAIIVPIFNIIFPA